MCPPEPKVPVRVVAGRARTSRVTLFFAGYAVGTVGWVRFVCVSVFSSGFPSPQPLSFLFPSTRTARFRVNGSPARVRIRDDRGGQGYGSGHARRGDPVQECVQESKRKRCESRFRP